MRELDDATSENMVRKICKDLDISTMDFLMAMIKLEGYKLSYLRQVLGTAKYDEYNSLRNATNKCIKDQGLPDKQNAIYLLDKFTDEITKWVIKNDPDRFSYVQSEADRMFNEIKKEME